MNYWVTRIAHEFPISDIVLRCGYLPVGWSNSAPELLKAANGGRILFNEQFAKAFPEYSNGDSLWRFIKDFNVGDVVVVPSPDEHSGKFSITKIKGDAELSKIAVLADIGFVRAVELLKADMPQTMLAKNVYSTLFACPLTTYSITKHGDEIQKLLEF